MKEDISTTVTILITCCGLPMKLGGHLERRDCSGGKKTRLAYECLKCFKRVQVVDEWDAPNAATLELMDLTP